MDNVTFLKGLYDAFGRGDMPTVLGAMNPGIQWHQAESNPYMPSGEAFVGPNAVMNNVFVRLGGSGMAFRYIPRPSTALGTASLSRLATPEPTRRPARAWTRKSAMSGTSRMAR